MLRMANNNRKGVAEVFDKYLSTIITTRTYLKQQVDIGQKHYNQHAGDPFETQTQVIITVRKSQSPGRRIV
jgi:hypothetical protein